MAEQVGEVRAVVFVRDGGCVALRIDSKAGPCHDAWGSPLGWRVLSGMEMDYIRKRSTGRRHELASDHVTLCPGHHRGMGARQGYVWATAHRPELREYLERWATDDETPTD